MKSKLDFLLTVLAIISLPIMFIWSINTLFNTGIPYTFSTWFAGFLILGFIMIISTNTSKNNDTPTPTDTCIYSVKRIDKMADTNYILYRTGCKKEVSWMEDTLRSGIYKCTCDRTIVLEKDVAIDNR